MALGGRQVHEPALAEQADPMAGLQRELLDTRSDEALPPAQFLQGGNIQLDVKIEGNEVSNCLDLSRRQTQALPPSPVAWDQAV